MLETKMIIFTFGNIFFTVVALWALNRTLYIVTHQKEIFEEITNRMKKVNELQREVDNAIKRAEAIQRQNDQTLEHVLRMMEQYVPSMVHAYTEKFKIKRIPLEDLKNENNNEGVADTR